MRGKRGAHACGPDDQVIRIRKVFTRLRIFGRQAEAPSVRYGLEGTRREKTQTAGTFVSGQRIP